MFVLLLLTAFCQDATDAKPKIEQFQVSDLDETITLRSDGTAEYRYRGRPNDFVPDERVGYFTAKFEVKKFHRIAALLTGVDIENLKDHRVAFPESISRLSIIHGGVTKILEIHDRRVASDPEPPDRLWALIMVIRGLRTTLHWEPIKSGVQLRFKGVSEKDRLIVVREPVSHFPIVLVRSSKQVVQIPIPPGVYSVEYEAETEGVSSGTIKTPATVKENEVAEVIVEK
jgi:hypothetical protein